MKRLFSIIVAVIACIVGLQAQNNKILSVGNEDNSISCSVPIHFSWGYSYSQVIYYAEELVPGEISSISYHYAGEQTEAASVIYIGEIEGKRTFDNMTDWVPVSQMQQVYSGTVRFTNGWVKISFDVPFSYSGAGNLVVAYLSNRDTYNPNPFIGTITDEDRVIHTQDDNTPFNPRAITDGKVISVNIPNTRFEIGVAGGYCMPVQGLMASSIAADSAKISWISDASSIVFGLEYKTEEEETWTLASNTINDDTYWLKGLSSDQKYQVKVYSICGEQKSSEAEMSFATTLAAEDFLPIPYEENFDNVPYIPFWEFQNSDPNAWCFGKAENNSVSKAESGAMYISSDGGKNCSYKDEEETYSYVSALVRFEEGSSYGLEFDWKGYGEACCDYMKVFLLPIDATLPRTDLPSYGEISDKYNNTTVWQKASIQIPDTCEGNAYKLVFAWKNNGNMTKDLSVAVDNIRLLRQNCQRVDSIFVSMSDISEKLSAEVSIESDSTETLYLVEYRIRNTEDWTSSVSQSPIVLTNLSYLTEYELRVTAICNGTDRSLVSEVKTFTTPCGKVENFPYIESFEQFFSADGRIGNEKAPLCWYNINGGNQGYGFEASNKTSYASTGEGSLYYYGTPSITQEVNDWIVSPAINLTGNEEVSFKIRNASYAKHSIDPIIHIYACDVSVDELESVEDTSRFELVETVTHASTDNRFVEYEVKLSQFNSATRIAFVMRNASRSFYLDDVMIDSIPECPNVHGVEVYAVSGTSVSVSFKNTANSLDGWRIVYGTAVSASAFDPTTADNVQIITASDPIPVIISDLKAGETYYFAVQQNCGGGNFSNTVSVTLPIVNELPYVQRFDNPERVRDFRIEGRTRNRWYIGEAENKVANFGKQNVNSGALYVSCDGGASAVYAPNTGFVTQTYAYTVLRFNSAAAYILSFDWKAGGEGETFDYMKVFLVPYKEEKNMFDPQYAITDNLNLSNRMWRHEDITLPQTYSDGIYKLIFYWTNDQYRFAQNQGAVVDNISINVLSCQPVESVNSRVLSSIVGEKPAISVDITDENEGASYVLQYKNDSQPDWKSVSGLKKKDFPYVIRNAEYNSHYQIQVSVVCAGGERLPFVQSPELTTPCEAETLPFKETFDVSPLLTHCWDRYTGMLPANGEIRGLKLRKANAGWEFNNSVAFSGETSGRIRANICGDSRYYWITSPSINLGNTQTTYQMAFDVAVSGYNPPDNGTPEIATDDKFALLASTDGGDTWTTILMFADNDADTRHNYSDLTNVFERHSFDLVDKNGNPLSGIVKFAFYGESQFRNGDNYLWIDNLSVGELSDCEPPYNVMVKEESITANSATIVWSDDKPEHKSWNVYYRVEGSKGRYEMETASTRSHTLHGLNPSETYEFYVTTNCGAEESENLTTSTFKTLCVPITSFPYFDGFEKGIDCWSMEYVKGRVAWDTVHSVSKAKIMEGKACLRFYDDNHSSYTTRLISPILDLGSLRNPTLSFKHIQIPWGDDQDSLKVYYRTSENAEPVLLASYTDPITSWHLETLTLPNPTSNYQILFEGTANYGWGVLIDELKIEDKLDGLDIDLCPAPYGIVADNITPSSADINWEGSTDSYEIRLNGGKKELVKDFYKMFVGLKPATEYTVEVRAVCSDTDSKWVPIKFKTEEEFREIAPMLTTLDAIKITDNSVVLKGEILEGSEAITMQGFQYQKAGESTWETIRVTGRRIETEVSELEPETLYYFQTFAATETNTFKGDIRDFKTLKADNEQAESGIVISIYPDVVKVRATIIINGMTQEGRIIISDAEGKVVKEDTLRANTKRYKLDAQKLKSGVYYVRVISGGETATKKFIVE